MVMGKELRAKLKPYIAKKNICFHSKKTFLDDGLERLYNIVI